MIDVKQLQIIIENLITSSMREVRDDKDLLDSFSPNQFLSKMNLINHINNLNILDKDSEFSLEEVVQCFEKIPHNQLEITIEENEN